MPLNAFAINVTIRLMLAFTDRLYSILHENQSLCWISFCFKVITFSAYLKSVLVREGIKYIKARFSRKKEYTSLGQFDSRMVIDNVRQFCIYKAYSNWVLPKWLWVVIRKMTWDNVLKNHLQILKSGTYWKFWNEIYNIAQTIFINNMSIH